MLPKQNGAITMIILRDGIGIDKESVLERILKKLVGFQQWSEYQFCIIDAQSVKNTDTAEEKGYVRKFQEYIAVDSQRMQFISQQLIS